MIGSFYFPDQTPPPPSVFLAHEVVVWRAACWGQRGVDAVLSGAFPYIIAHMAVSAEGGIFWQTILAENALQAALGQRNKVICESSKDVDLQFCGEDTAGECSIDSRHCVLEADITIVDKTNRRARKVAKFRVQSDSFDTNFHTEEAPWMF